MQSNETPTQPNFTQNELLLDENYYQFPYEQNALDNMHVLHRQPSTGFQDYAINETFNVQSPQDYVNTSRRNELHVSNVSPSFTSMSHSNSFASTSDRFDFPPDNQAFPSSRTFQRAYSNIRPQSNASLIPESRLTSQYDAFTEPYIPSEAPPFNTLVLPSRPSTSSGAVPNLSHEYSTFSDNMLLSHQNNQPVTNIIPELNDYHPTHSFASPTSHFGIKISDVAMLFPNNVQPQRSNSLTFHSNSQHPRQILPLSRNVLQPLEQIVPPEIQHSSPSTQQATYYYAYNISNKICSSKQPNTQETVDIGKKSFVCDYCGKALSRKTKLKIHTRIHTGEKPYVCKQCGKKFIRIDYLKNHTLVHTGEKPYECETCGKRFYTKGKLTRHYIIHSDEIPYQCETCGKRFNFQGNLKNHYIVHSDEMPYQCETCGKRFNYESNLKKHYVVHSDEIPYQCETCGKRFYYECSLKKHKVRSCEKP